MKIIFLVPLLFSSLFSSAQVVIKGEVVHRFKKIKNAQITVYGTNNTETTDSLGRFTLKLDSIKNQMIFIYAPKYKSKYIYAKNNSFLKIRLWRDHSREEKGKIVNWGHP